MARFKRFVLATLWMAAGLMIGSAAEAQCIEGNPEMVCDVATCLTLQGIVNGTCKGPAGPRTCQGIDGCAPLTAERNKFVACLAAREEVKATCFPFGTSHDQARSDTENAIRKCETRMARPKPLGCTEPEDPCS